MLALSNSGAYASPCTLPGPIDILFNDLTDNVSITFTPNNPGCPTPTTPIFSTLTSGETAKVSANLSSNLNTTGNAGGVLDNFVALTEPGGGISDVIEEKVRANGMTAQYMLTFTSDSDDSEEPLTAPPGALLNPEKGVPQEVFDLVIGPSSADQHITVRVDSDVPEPASLSVLTLGLLGLGVSRFRRRRALTSGPELNAGRLVAAGP